MGSTSEYTIQLRGNHDKFQTCRSSDLVPGGTYETSLYVYYAPHTYFRVMQMSSFVQQINHLCTSFFHCIIISLVNESTTFVSPDRWWYYPTTSVLAAWQLSRIFVIFRGDWLSIKCCENDSFRKLFLFFENTFQYLGGKSHDISVSHFDSRRSLSSANRRWFTLLILFVSPTQPCDQHDWKIRTICKSTARWRRRRARGYRKLILRANLLCDPNIEI